MSDQLTPEYMRDWEMRLSGFQRQIAFSHAWDDGWRPGDNVPMFAWAEYFRRAEAEYPPRHG